jgi:hypothetical protein
MPWPSRTRRCRGLGPLLPLSIIPSTGRNLYLVGSESFRLLLGHSPPVRPETLLGYRNRRVSKPPTRKADLLGCKPSLMEYVRILPPDSQEDGKSTNYPLYL